MITGESHEALSDAFFLTGGLACLRLYHAFPTRPWPSSHEITSQHDEVIDLLFGLVAVVPITEVLYLNFAFLSFSLIVVTEIYSLTIAYCGHPP